MNPEDVPDWRIFGAAKVAQVNGREAEPGLIAVHLTSMKIPDEGHVSFVPVSPYRLALSIAIRASHDAKELRKAVRFEPPSNRPRGSKGPTERVIDLKTLPALYDFFECAMVAATFSYQVIETYANTLVEERIQEGETLTLERGKETKTYDAAGVQRQVSTSEKVATVLPRLLGIPLEKSGHAGRVWQEFVQLDRLRDSIIHLKPRDNFVRTEIDRRTVFYSLLQRAAAADPRTAIRVIEHFNPGGKLSWLEHAAQALGRG